MGGGGAGLLAYELVFGFDRRMGNAIVALIELHFLKPPPHHSQALKE